MSDDIEPSVRHALAHPDSPQMPLDRARVADLIRAHHKITPFRGRSAALVNAFRRADWYDVMFGLFGRWSPDTHIPGGSAVRLPRGAAAPGLAPRAQAPRPPLLRW